MNSHDPQKYVGRLMDLHFANGHVVRANLVLVDAEETQEILCDVKEVLEAGPRELSPVKPGIVAAAEALLLKAIPID